MNIHSIVTPELRACINAVPKKEWEIFFNLLKKQETDTLGKLSIDALTALQEHVNILNQLEHAFKTLREQSTNR